MVKVKVLAAVVDGKKQGEQLDVSEVSAAYLSSIGYVERVSTRGKAEQGNAKGHAPKAKPQGKGKKEEVGE